MNPLNALGFLVVGVLMNILPRVEPQHFRHFGPDGTSAGAIWTVGMGLIIACLGGGYLLSHHIWPSLKRLAAYRTPQHRPMTPQRVSR